MAKSEKTSEKEDTPEPGSLVVPDHGRGAIRYGSLPGNTPGTGRPPSRVKADLRGDFDERRAILKEIADDKTASPRDRLKAIDVMAKYSDLGDTSLPTEDVLREMAQAVLAEGVDPETWERIEERWVDLLAARLT